ncbi:MAG: hypothetical protein NC340_10700 [Ruminococcus flavefaciens]|nr:hypothetical protein [Ruminococcus flavefaciens]MCM1232802.1 hypothetical protein [Ruminococcus flavefaciens]
MKHRILFPLISAVLLLTSCSQIEEIQTDREQNKVYKWDAYPDEEDDEDFEAEIIISDFPDVTFKWTDFSVTATENGNEKELIWGMPVMDVYFTDLTNDGFPEICSTVMVGSGICDMHIEVYDYKNDKQYVLAERMLYDYNLIMKDDELLARRSPYGYYGNGTVETGKMAIEDDVLKFVQ